MNLADVDELQAILDCWRVRASVADPKERHGIERCISDLKNMMSNHTTIPAPPPVSSNPPPMVSR